MKTNDNENNGITKESIKDLIENANLGGSDSNDSEKKARIDLLKESIIAAMVDSNINKDEEDEEEPETEDDEEHFLDDDEIAEIINASIADSNNEGSETYDDMDDDDLDKALGYQGRILNMDASDYHNQTCVLARANHIERAVDVAVDGLKRFKYNPTLLADVIKYCTEAGDMDRAARYYSMLNEKVDLCRWDWRAFTYSFDYLLASGPENEKEMRILIKNFKKYFNRLEKPYFLTAQLEEYLGKTDKSMKALEGAIQRLPNASQCALKLADMQIDNGLFEQTIITCNYGIAAAAMTQPTINTSYLVLLRTLAKDHLLHRKVCNGEEISEAELRSVEEDYKHLISKFKKELHHYYDMMEVRLKLLSFINTNF